MITVELDWSEMQQGALAGVNRRIRAIRSRRRTRDDSPPPDGYWETDINGALCELAAAKALKLFWSDTSRLDKNDGDFAGLQVRGTTHKDGRLIVYRDDYDNQIYLLVIQDGATFVLRGWILGADAKRDRYWNASARIPAYFVPQDALNDMSQL